MTSLKRWLATAAIGISLVVGVTACDDIDNGTTTTSPTGTTDPVGS